MRERSHNRGLASVALLLALSAGGSSALAQNYVFTKIADSSVNDFDPFSMGAPSISDLGHVAFSGPNADGSESVVRRTGPGLAGPLTVIADTAVSTEVGSFFDSVSVNNAGEVAMWATIRTPRTVDERIYRGDGGPLTTLGEAGDASQFSFMSVITSINDSGVGAWQGELNQPNGPQGLFRGSGSQPADVLFSTASSNFTSSFAGPTINNAGQIAFRASTTTSGGDAIFRYDGGSTFVTIVNSSGPYSAAFDDEPAMNSAGRVAVIGRSNDLSITYVLVGDGAGPIIEVADTTGDLESINVVAINDSNQVAFIGLFDDFSTQGIFTGPDLVNDKVIKTGDALDGSIILGLSFYREGLNDSGQIAFYATLEDGRGVVVVATPAGCAADFNGDSQVDFFDYLDFVAAFAGEEPAADFNGDSQIDFFDYLDFVAAFATGCE